MRYTFTVLCAIVVLFIVSGFQKGKNDLQTADDILKLEKTIGENSGLTGDYILVRPFNVCANAQGDILVSDEFKIKVYDINGKPKIILGRQGQGPGEYMPGIFPVILTMGPTGYFLGISTPISGKTNVSFYYNLYTPDFKFVEMKRLDTNPVLEKYLISKGYSLKNIGETFPIYPLNSKELVYRVLINNNKVLTLLYDNTQQIKEIYCDIQPERDVLLGNFLWRVLSNNNVTYINTYKDTINEKGSSWYTIHIISLIDFKDTVIKQNFKPIVISDEYLKTLTIRQKTMTDEALARRNEFANNLRKQKYLPSVYTILSDGNYLFLFLYEENFYKSPKENTLTKPVDIFDMNAKKFIKRVYFPNVLNYVSNGYEYTWGKDKDGYPEIRKYKINPAVYGK